MDRESLKAKVAKLYELGVDDEAVNAYIKANSTPELTAGRAAGLVARGATPVLTGAAAGAALGTLVAPGVGTAAGGLLGSLALPVADLGVGAYNLFSEKDAEYPSEKVGKILTAGGFPSPETTTERALEVGGSALGGAGSQIRAFAGLARNAAQPLVRRASQFMASSPKSQMVAAAPSAMTAQAVTEKTDNPLLGTAAGLATAGGIGAAGSARMRPQLPAATRQETRNAAQSSYRTSEGADVVIEEAPFTSFVATVRPRVANDRFDRGLHPNTARILDRLDEEVGAGPLSYERLETLRRIAQSGSQIARRSGNSDDARMARSIVRDIDTFQNNLTPNELLMGDIDVARPALNRARDLWRRNAKMHSVETIMDVADDLDDPKIIQQRFRALVKDREEFGQFTQAEQRIIRSIARTGSLDAIGKLSPASDLFGMLKTAGWAAAGLSNPTTLALPALAMGAKTAGNRSRISNIQALQDTISRGRPAMSPMERLYFRRPFASANQTVEGTALRLPSPIVTEEDDE